MFQQICYCFLHFYDHVAEFRYHGASISGRMTGQIQDCSKAWLNHPPRYGVGEHYVRLWDIQFRTHWSQAVSEHKFLKRERFL